MSGKTQAVRILLIEDNPSDVFLIEYMLKKENIAYELRVIDDGEKALKYAAQPEVSNAPDLFIIDLNLPKHDGTEILTVLRRNATFSKIPTVVLTCSESPLEEDCVKQFEIDAFLRKSSTLANFLKVGPVISKLLANSLRN